VAVAVHSVHPPVAVEFVLSSCAQYERLDGETRRSLLRVTKPDCGPVGLLRLGDLLPTIRTADPYGSPPVPLPIRDVDVRFSQRRG
jgi:hypothetical protein